MESEQTGFLVLVASGLSESSGALRVSLFLKERNWFNKKNVAAFIYILEEKVNMGLMDGLAR